MSSSGTARFVDSSLEKVQVRLKGLKRQPVHFTLQWQPCSSKRNRNNGRICLWNSDIGPGNHLQPFIRQSGWIRPLVFDIVDSWNNRSIEVVPITFHTRGGSNTFLINAYEAESRRVSRFGDTSHTQDVLRPAPYLAVVAHYIEQNRISLP